MISMYKIKQLAEDFIVSEIVDYDLLLNGRFYVFKLVKKGYNTLDAIKTVAKKFGISLKEIGYAGLKDRNAVTTQFISIVGKKNLDDSYDFENIKLELAGYRDERLYPGCLKGNCFEIIIRNIIKRPKEINRIVNYFGEQRFSKNNIEIGRMIVKRDFAGAAKLIAESDKRYESLYESLTESIERKNVIGYLQKIDLKLLMLYVHSYQAFIWNECVKIYLKDNKEKHCDIHMPLIGFGYDSQDMGCAVCDGIIKRVMDSEGISPRDFILRSIPELSQEGGCRDVFVDLHGLKIGDLEEDELNDGKKKCRVEFALSKGSYATECIKQMIE